ncbi:MAG: lytic murein transglycosylase [Proteobacteria bacterium]|nr:lytic murein transglycosylase [Pseudomonadota bacterium]
MRKTIALAAALAALTFSTPAFADKKFEALVESLWPRVKAAGFSRSLFDSAFAGITEPDATVLKLASTQPEFTSTTSAYLAKAVTPIRIETGKVEKQEEAALLAAIEKKYGVDRHILLGIWGMESNFGKDKGSMSVMRSLATLIYAGRKKKYAQEQLIAAFRILQKGIRSPDNFTGSWAAAMGHTQFIPTSYLSYAVDWTGDGKRDIWGSKEDALASTANYLAKAGWKSDRPWGWEVVLPDGFNRAMIGRSKWRTVAEWSKLGLKRADGQKFGAANASAFVMIPQGIDGPVFLVTQNFMAIMDYNLSHSYAIAVGHLADRIRGGGPIQASWPEISVNLSFEQRVELQRRLSGMGFETGGADGRFGARTYEAIIAFQRKAGITMDGKPSLKLLERVRKGV